MDDAKKKILARRAQFVAAALAGLTAQACGKENVPQPCLSPPPEHPSDAAPPMPCLSPAIPVVAPPDAEAPDAGPQPDGGPKRDAAAPHAKPKPCLLVDPDAL